MLKLLRNWVILIVAVSASLPQTVLSLLPCCKWGDNCWPSQNSFTTLEKDLLGHILHANSSWPISAQAFHKATSISDELYQKIPAIAMIPASESDVQRIVYFLAQQAATQKRPLCVSVRGGGGSLIGRSSTSGGVHISLEKLDNVKFHTLDNGSVVTVGGGANWGQVQAAANVHRQFLPTAECPKLGVGGFTQNGGGTIMSRSLGLVSDNLIAFNIVLPNGTAVSITHSDASDHPIRSLAEHSHATREDIWWAVRGGGGGSWGIISSFTFRTQPQPDHVLGLTCTLPLAPEKIQAYFDLLPTVSNSWGLTAVLGSIEVPFGKPASFFLLEGVYFGTWSAGYASVRSFLDANPSACTLSNWTRFGWWENLAEGAAGCELLQTGRVYATSLLSQVHHLRNTSGFAQLLHDFLSSGGKGTRACTPSQLGGQIQKIGGSSGGAVSPYLRAGLLDTACVTRWSHASDDTANIASMRDFSQVLRSGQYGQGTYIGEPVFELEADGHTGWESAYWDEDTVTKLKRIKHAIDPLNVLHCPQCISAPQTEMLSV